jgi:hypothetical protein
MNAHQRRIAKRKLARRLPPGTKVRRWYMPSVQLVVAHHSANGRVVTYDAADPSRVRYSYIYDLYPTSTGM